MTKVDRNSSHLSRALGELNVRAVGKKQITERDSAFKRMVDPHGLLNPGRFEVDAASDAAFELTLPTDAWHKRIAESLGESPRIINNRFKTNTWLFFAPPHTGVSKISNADRGAAGSRQADRS